MTFDLDTIQEMWEKDSKIDMDNLHTESTNIPTLHAKYFELYNTIFLMRKKAEQQRKNIRHERYEYFSGKADPEVYIEKPFPKVAVPEVVLAIRLSSCNSYSCASASSS